jgi:hypothetical protein
MQATLSYCAYEALLKTRFDLGNLLSTVLKRTILNFTKIRNWFDLVWIQYANFMEETRKQKRKREKKEK